MKLFDKYSVNGQFNNYSLESMLKDLDISSQLINDVIIRSSISSLTKELIKRLKKLDEEENIINVVLEFFLTADKMKPIKVNKITLSKLTGLSERTIDIQRTKRGMPFDQLSGPNGVGRKTIVYDPIEVKNYLKQFEVKPIS